MATENPAFVVDVPIKPASHTGFSIGMFEDTGEQLGGYFSSNIPLVTLTSSPQ
jgi:hypothetical protein